MRGRKPRSLRIIPHDAPILQEIARSRSLPWYQIQRARIVLGVAAGEPIQLLAVQTQHDPSTIWRVCRRYEDSGLSGLLAPPRRTGRPARISPPPEGSDRPAGLPGADRRGAAHHALDEQGPGPPSSRRRYYPVHQRPDGPYDPRRGRPPTTPHTVLEDRPSRCRVQAEGGEGPLVLWERRSAGQAGLLGGLR
jgi:hypothetical protein